MQQDGEGQDALFPVLELQVGEGDGVKLGEDASLVLLSAELVAHQLDRPAADGLLHGL